MNGLNRSMEPTSSYTKPNIMPNSVQEYHPLFLDGHVDSLAYQVFLRKNFT